MFKALVNGQGIKAHNCTLSFMREWMGRGGDGGDICFGFKNNFLVIIIIIIYHYYCFFIIIIIYVLNTFYLE